MQAARLRISQSQSTVELARSAMGLQATAVGANRLRITDKSFSWPYSYSLPVDKTAPDTLNTVGVGAAEYRSRGPISTGRRRYWRENARLAETAGIDRHRQQRGAALFRHAGDVPENRAAAGAGGHCPISVEAHEHRTRRGLDDSVDVANARPNSSPLASRSLAPRGC